MLDKELLDWCAATFGGNVGVSRRYQVAGLSRTLWCWEVAARDELRRVLKDVRPFLRVKHTQADLLLQWLRYARYDAGLDALDCAWAAMDDMNVRG